MARGTPVSRLGRRRCRKQLADAAAYFEPADPDGLARALGELLADGGAREELARRGLARAAEYSWARTARETAAVYRELL